MVEGGGFECEFVKEPLSVIQTNCPICMGVDTSEALGAEAPPDFQALQYIQYKCMETNS